MGGGLFMFGLGALVAWSYSRHKEREAFWAQANGENPNHHFGCRHWGRGPWGGHYEQRPQMRPDAPYQTAEKSAAPPQPSTEAAIPATQQQQWQELQILGRQAGDRMTEMSEATIDSLVAGLQSLKSRIVEHRIQQEQLSRPSGPASTLQPVSSRSASPTAADQSHNAHPV